MPHHPRHHYPPPGRAGRAGPADRSPLQVAPHNHLLQLHDIRVAKAQEQRDLSEAADGDPCKQTWPQQASLQTGTPDGSVTPTPEDRDPCSQPPR